MHPLNQPSPEPRRDPRDPTPQPWKSPWAIDDDVPAMPPRRQAPLATPPAEAPPPISAPRPVITPQSAVPSVTARSSPPASAEPNEVEAAIAAARALIATQPPPSVPEPVKPTQQGSPPPAASPSVRSASAPLTSPHPATVVAPRAVIVPQAPPRAPVAAPVRQEESSPEETAKSIGKPVDEKHQAIKRMLENEQQRRMQKLLAVAMGTFVFMLLAWFYTADDAMPMDNDLLTSETTQDPLARPPRAPDLLKLALESAVPVGTDSVVGQPAWRWDTTLLANTARANAVALDNLRDLVSQKDWSPQHSTWELEDLGENPKWEDLSVAKTASIAYFAKLNDDESAMQAALELAQLAKQMQGVSAWPNFYSRGNKLHQLACENISELLRTTRLNSRKLAYFQQEFERTAPSGTLLHDAMSHYYRFEKDLVLSSNSRSRSTTAKRLPRIFFKPNQTLELFVKSFRELSKGATQPPYLSSVSMPIASWIGPPNSPLTTLTSPNRSGINLANQRIWPYAMLVERQGLQSALHVVVLTQFAIRRFAMDHGTLPLTLSDLMPNYLRDLPKDPYNGEPLHYDAQRGVLYSIGQDYKDDGGRIGNTPLSDAFEPTAQVK